jgi:hypothetical protein
VGGNCKLEVDGSCEIAADKAVTLRSDTSLLLQAPKIEVFATGPSLNLHTNGVAVLDGSLVKLGEPA